MSLYLKYRPLDFNNLVGQSFVKDTLQKAIEKEKTVGAYLLCGPRGTGKTSTARILAKTINCENPQSGNPCLKCNICVDFLDEKLIDIIEIDAASHTGVDNIRGIIEKAQFKPSKTKYKVYIIDEVHMLSKGAFNALLKILEEPPKHVKFILATTETHKVPETIISRCQRYDFKRISDIDILNRLQYIADEEKVLIDERSLKYIIKNSSGGMRNAISLFEQLITDGEINYKIITKKLEIVDENIIDEFLNKLISRDSSIIDILDKIILDGKNIKLFFKEVLFYTKNKSLDLLKSGEDISKYINILDILDETYSKTKNSLDENTTFLIGVLKIIRPQVETIIQQAVTIPEQKINKPVIKQAVSVSETKTESIDNLSIDDGAEIFGAPEVKVEPKPITKANNSGGSFDIDSYINKLKENGAKGGLTMAIRGSTLSLGTESLNVGVKTKIAKGQMENVDNMSLMSKSLSDLGFTNFTIKIN